METSKQGFVSIPAPGSSAKAQGEDGGHEVQASLPAMYLQTLGRLPLYSQVHSEQPTCRDAVAFPLSISPLPAKQALPLLTFHITGGMHLQQQGQRSGAAAPPARPKSAGKHVCPHCGRDCLKPSVLEKHLRCHTGERPYPCTICGIAFKTQSNLYKHKRTQAHARLSSESEKGSFSSQECVPGSGDTYSSSTSLRAASEDSESFEREAGAALVTPCAVSSSTQPPAALGKIGSDTGWALHQAALVGLILAPVNGNQEKLSSIIQKADQPAGLGISPAAKPPTAEGEPKPPPAALTPNRHLLLQRQEATFFSKQWESSTSRGKSQSHDSTDSGFSESNEQHWSSSPGSTLHDHSMESLTESSMEHQEDLGLPENPSDPAAIAAAGVKGKVSVLEKRKLEERISKLISENETLVDDKRLENVRPRKTVLSKQGSIDLPMPYTYKDSFHFEMRTSKQMSMASSQQSPDRRVKQALHSSVPTQQSTSLDHMPLTRSSSLPFCFSSLERSSQHGHNHREGVLLGRRDSSGQLYSSELSMKSVDQQSSHHRSLVRQSAVDCLPASEGLSVTSSVEENYPTGLGSDGDSIDAFAESGGGKCRRKKAQKFSYNKWHMYGGGTFTKLYNTEKGSDHGSLRTKKAVVSTEQGRVHESQSRNTASLPEPIASAASTTDHASAATSFQNSCRSQCLPDSLASTCGSPPAQGYSSHLSSEPHLQRPPLSDLSGSTDQCGVRQGSLLAPGCTNSSRTGFVKHIIQKQQNTQHNTTPQCLSYLPSERKKQRTEDGTGIIDSGEKRHNIPASMINKAGDNTYVRLNQPSLAFCSSDTLKYTHPTNSSDTNKLPLQHQSSRMDLNQRFISHKLNQRSLQNQGHDSLPSLAGMSRLSDSGSVTTTSNFSALTKSSFLPKYQLKLPHSAVSEQSLPAIPALEQRLMTIPASEQNLTVILTSEQGITAIPLLEKSLTAKPAVDTEQSLPPISTPTSEHCLPAIPTPTSEHCLPAILTPTSEHCLPAIPTPTSEQCLPAIPTPTSEQCLSDIPTPTSKHSFPAVTTPFSEHCLPAIPTPFSEQCLPAIPTPTSEHGLCAISTSTSEHCLHAIPTPTSEHCLRAIPTPTSEQCLHAIPTPTSEQCLSAIPSPPSEDCLPAIPTPTLEHCLPAIPTPTSEYCLHAIPTPTSEHCLRAIPTPTSEHCLHAIPTPTSEHCLPVIPTFTSEHSLPAIPTPSSEHCLPAIPTPSSEHCLPAIPTPSSEQCLSDIPTPTPEHCLSAVTTPTSEQSLHPISTPTSEKCLTSAPTITSKTSNTSKPKLAIKLNDSPTPNPASTKTTAAVSTSSETCATSTTASGLSHAAAPTSGQMHTASLENRATCTPASIVIDPATPSSVLANQSTLFPTVESLSAGKVIMLKGVSHAASQETDYVKAGDIQIFLQIISDDQLSLMEAQLSTQNSQQEPSVCQAVPLAAVENAGAGIPGQSISQQPNVSENTRLFAASAQGHGTTDTARVSPTQQASSAQLSGPSFISYWETFSRTEQHQQNQSCAKSAQSNFSDLKSIHTPSKDFGEVDQAPVGPGHEAGGSELRTIEGQFASVHTESQMHNQCRPGDSGVPTLTKKSECPNQEETKEVSVHSKGDRLPQQRVRAGMADCPALLYSQASPTSLTSSTAAVDMSAYPRLYIPDLCSGLADGHTRTEKQALTDTQKRASLTFLCAAGSEQQHRRLPSEVPRAVQKNAVNAAAALPLKINCRVPLTSHDPKNKTLSAHKHHPSPPPNPLHMWDVARCPDGHLSSDSMHCQDATPPSGPCGTDRPTTAEPVGGGDTSSTSHLSPTSNRLFTHPHAKTALPTAGSHCSTHTSSCKGPNLFQGSVTQSPTVRQCTMDTDSETLEGVQGHGSRLADLRQPGTDSAVSPPTPRLGLQHPIQKCLPGVTQELPQQVTSEHATLGSVPPEPIVQQQAQNERRTLEAPVYNRSMETCLRAPHPAQRASHQEPLSASLSGQHKLCLTAGISLSPLAAAEISSGSVLLHVSVQHKPLNQRVPSHMAKQRTKCGIIANEAVANPTATSGGACLVQPACTIGGSGMAQASQGIISQSTESSSPSFLFSSLVRKGPLSQDPVEGAGPSTEVLQPELSQLALKPSDTLCGLLTGPRGRTLSGGSLNICPLTSSQMLLSRSEPQDQQGLKQDAPNNNVAADQDDMALDSFVSPPCCAAEERQKGGTLLFASADIRKGSQDLDTGHTSSSSSAAHRKQEEQCGGQHREEPADRAAVEQASRRSETMERGGVGEASPGASPSSEPHKGATLEDDLGDSLDDHRSLPNRGPSVLPHFPQTPSQRETAAAHALQVHTHRETSILHILQTYTQSETSVVQTRSEAGVVHTSHRDSRHHATAQDQLREYIDERPRSTEQGVHRVPHPPLSAAQQSRSPTEARPLPVNAGPSGGGTAAQTASRGVSSTPPLQSAVLSAGGRVQREGPRATGKAGAGSAAERLERPAPATGRGPPLLSRACALAPSQRAGEAPGRATHGSQEEADTSSSDDEGRLVIELE